MTERLYYTDPYLREFDATLIAVQPAADGRVAAILDRTAFYPTSGGQPFDTGTLNDARVVDVMDGENGAVLHIVEGHLGAGQVHGTIDWDRRFEHMQQHTGQHVLSSAFDRLASARTVSFHLGSHSSTIDLAREVSAREVALCEAEANRIVWEDRPVHIRFVDSSDAVNLPLRKEPVREGVLRLIDVEQYDLSACGGTHVGRTGGIGIVVVASTERFRGGTRVEFLCGGRALRGFRDLRQSVADSIRLLSVLPAELPAAVERLQTEGRELKRRIRDLQGSVASAEAESFAASPEQIGGLRAVFRTLEGWDPNGLKSIASAIVERPGHVVVLFGSPAPMSVVVARSADAQVDCAAVLRRLTARFGGKGGGRPELAQGGGLAANPEELLAEARALIAQTR